jgi:arylsulfatase A-like enzyme
LNSQGDQPNQSGTNGHGSGQSEHSAQLVPWIARGPGIKAGYTIKQPVSIIDTGATVLRIMGLETHTEWQSQPVEEIFEADHAPKAASATRADH